MSIIQISNLIKSYDTLTVLDIPSLSIERHQITSIIGPSGAGKSTLLQILGTLLKPTSGTIIFDGRDISNLNDTQLAHLRNRELGFVFQHHNLLPEFTALENTTLPAMIANTDAKIYQTRGKELLDYMGLADRMNHKPSQLSGGEQQRVAIARALINNPKMIFADEPTGNLDSNNAKEIHTLFQSINQELGHTFLLVTHNPALSDLAHQVIRLRDGKLDPLN